MSDLRNLTIIGLLGRLNALIDDGGAVLSPHRAERRDIFRETAAPPGEDAPEFWREAASREPTPEQ